MRNHINNKVIIAISFATIMIMVGFTGLMYYNPENNTGNKINIPKLGYYINKYDLKAVHSMNNIIPFNNPDVANSTSNNTIKMSYTFYNGTNNVTGTLLKIYENGKLLHESLLVNKTDNKNYNYSVIPLYSKSGNYNITEITNNTNATDKNDVYVDLQAIYSRGSNGCAIAFTQDMTGLLIAVLLAGAVLAGVATAGVLAAILSLGAILIGLYDGWGGKNGVFFFVAHYWWWTYAWINSPYNQVPNDLKDYGSYTVTLYNGDLQ